MPKNSRPFFMHRFGPVAVIILMVCVISFVTRLVLFVKSWPFLDLSFINVTGIFLIGLLYDMVVGLFFAIPVSVYCWLMKDSWFQNKWQRIPLFIFFSILTFILLVVAGGEIGFWHEFSVRFNFIAVDYIVYTNEVIGSIFESYNFTYIFGGMFIVSVAILLLFKNCLLYTSPSPRD